MVCSIASFAPQVNRIKSKGACIGISVNYILYNTILATYNFALLLWAALNYNQENMFFPQKPGVAAWLDLVQFTVAWLGQLFLYVLDPPIVVQCRSRQDNLA